MKPLNSTRVHRGQELKEWISAADHLTDDGKQAFAKRMKGYATKITPAPRPLAVCASFASGARKKT